MSGLYGKGINTVPATLADGTKVFYYYSKRKGGQQFWSSSERINLREDLPEGFERAFERAIGKNYKPRRGNRYNGREISPAVLAELLSYNPETGELTWNERDRKWFSKDCYHRQWNKMHAGKPAFTSKNSKGYLHGSVHGKTLQAHRVAYAIYHGEWPDHIDHINHNTTDNRIVNIRSVTQAENNRNRRPTISATRFQRFAKHKV